jgi:hypothetical protein
MVDFVFVKENKCLRDQKIFDLEKPHNCILFQLEIPHVDVEPIQLTGSKIVVTEVLGDMPNNNAKYAYAGTVTDVLRGMGKYREDLRLGEHSDAIPTVFARIRPDLYDDLAPLSFESDNSREMGWFYNFSVSKGKGEASGVIPLKNIEGYIVPVDMAEKQLCNYWRVGWPYTDACGEFLKRQTGDAEVIRSDDLLTVSTILKKKETPFDERDIERESMKYGKPIKQIETREGLSKRYCLVDEVRF